MGKTFKVAKDIKESKGFPTAPGGTYTFKTTPKMDIKTKNGVATLVVHAKIIKGPHAGKTVFENIQLSKNVEWKLAQFLTSIGLSLKKVRGKSLDLAKLVGKTFRATIREETYQGKKNNKIVTFMKLSATGSAAAEETEEETGEEELDEDVEETGDEDAEEDAEEAGDDDEEAGEESDDDEASDDEESEEDAGEEETEEDADEEVSDDDEEAVDDDEAEASDDDEEDDEAAAKARRIKRRKLRAAKAAKAAKKVVAKKVVAKKKK
jgi:hypothetical protein